MGKMSFPEDENKPSRTIMATRSMTTREALIYKSEYNRHGDGEYRLPTIREIATLMGFPYTYQFSGGENTKWRQIGNAVCPPMSSALAKSVRLSMNLKVIPNSNITFDSLQGKLEKIENLNTFSEKQFNNPPRRKLTARFRKHPFKEGNMTIALTNFNPVLSSNPENNKIEWYSSIFMGSGKDFILKVIPKSWFRRIAKHIEKHDQELGERFIKDFEKKFGKIAGNTSKFQDAYTKDVACSQYEPSRLVEEIADFIRGYSTQQQFISIPDLVPEKSKIPMKQAMAMYAINRIVS